MFISIVNLKLYKPWFAVCWRLGAVRLEECTLTLTPPCVQDEVTNVVINIIVASS